MPYSGPNDPTLPDYIKEKPLSKREQWVATFNSIIADCKDTPKECEEQAFRIANSSIAERKNMPVILLPVSPDIGSKIVIPNQIPIEDMHVTMAYFPNFDIGKLQYTVDMLNELSYFTGPLRGRMNGLGRFINVDNNQDAIIALPDLPELPSFRQLLVDVCEGMLGIECSREHGYIPHITLSYIPSNAPWPIDRIQPMELSFHEMVLSFSKEEGGMKFNFPLMGEADLLGYEGMHSRAAYNAFDDFIKDRITSSITSSPKFKATHNIQLNDKPDPQMLEAAKAMCLAQGNSLKAFGKNEDGDYIVGNYIVLFGGRDLYGVRIGDTQIGNTNLDGSRGEFFTKRTDLSSDYTITDNLIFDWEHGRKPDGVGPGADNPIGKVLWKTAEADDVGVFVQRVLNRQNAYIQALMKLAEEGQIRLGTSSEAVPELVEKAPNGEILKWGLRADTLTVTPMEPRNLGQNTLKNIAPDWLVSYIYSKSNPNGTIQNNPEEGDRNPLDKLGLERKKRLTIKLRQANCEVI